MPLTYWNMNRVILCMFMGFPMALVVENPPANSGDEGIWVPTLRQEDPLEEGMATHSSILAGKIP